MLRYPCAPPRDPSAPGTPSVQQQALHLYMPPSHSHDVGILPHPSFSLPQPLTNHVSCIRCFLPPCAFYRLIQPASPRDALNCRPLDPHGRHSECRNHGLSTYPPHAPHAVATAHMLTTFCDTDASSRQHGQVHYPACPLGALAGMPSWLFHRALQDLGFRPQHPRPPGLTLLCLRHWARHREEHETLRWVHP